MLAPYAEILTLFPTGHHRTREEYLKNKEEEEARKAGTLPPQTDEEGRDINPHIPDYVKSAPWYLETSQPTLSHQTNASFGTSKRLAGFGEFAPRGSAGAAATKYRKGACANCGSMTHDAKSCVERPRKLGAKFTGRNIKADEHTGEVATDYAGKHDPYARYNADDYKDVIDRYDRLEEQRREARAAEDAKRLMEAKDKLPAGATGPDDEFKVEEGQDNFGQFAKTDTRSARSVRDLRIREDTAKYLINRTEDAPFYDPKSRSMRANPRAEEDGEASGFTGDNQNRFTGDTSTFYDMQRFAWEHSESTQNATSSHVEASPSAAADQFRVQQAKQKEEREKFQKQMLETYGGGEHLQSLPAELSATSEVYTEYKRDGSSVKAAAKAIPKSKYAEDVFPGNHTSVWGSYYSKGNWGYRCCHQTTRSAYCTGKPLAVAAPTKSSAAAVHADVPAESTHKPKHSSKDDHSDSDSSSSSEEERRRRRKKRKSKRRHSSSSSSSSSDSDDSEGRPSKKKVSKYLKEEKRAKLGEVDERARPYNSTGGDQDHRAPSAARMEAYFMAQEREDDPMKKMMRDEAP